jgi:ribose 5-phosphate isomerase RpiB
MKIAVINEVSACPKNGDILRAVKSAAKAEIINAGMTKPDDKPELTYIHTSYMAAILLNAGACDFVVGGCGTGQGFLNAVLQFPGVICGLITDPLDAWLFSQINGGNCISLPLNKGYGWAADINLKYIFEKLFLDPAGQGFPPERAESQAVSRKTLSGISEIAHQDIMEILQKSDKTILRNIARSEIFMRTLENTQVGKKMISLLQEAS